MTYELRITELHVGCLGGLIGLSSGRGPKRVAEPTKFWNRGLAADLDAISAWNAAAVVTLMQADEGGDDPILEIGEEIRARFIEWHLLPLASADAPDAAFEALLSAHSNRLRALVAAGNRVLIDSRGAPSRAGMVAARLLLEMGIDPDAAIAAARQAQVAPAFKSRNEDAWVRQGRRYGVADPDPVDGRDRAIGALLGLAVGDAIGTTIEFSAKPTRAVLADMVGGGPFGLQPGQWTDDTAMALALGSSLLAHPDLDPTDLMRRFLSWHRDGAYSCTGSCFDIGITTAAALRRFDRTGESFAGSTDPRGAGNGSIMRLAPVAIRHWRDRGVMARIARDQSRTTHAAPEAVAGCEILADLIAAAIRGSTLSDLVTSDAAGRVRGFRIGQPRGEVRGTGYVVASLHAAFWAVSRTSTFRDAVLLAANLGEDADTTAAIAGQIAGALYGAVGIPREWLDRLAWSGRIAGMAGELFDAGAPRPAA